MRKLLILMLVLGMASLASAELIFTVDGEPQPDEVWISPCPFGEIELDLELSAAETCTGYTLGYTLSNNQAEFLWDGTLFPIVFDFEGKTQNESAQYLEITAGQLNSDPVEGPAVLMTDLYVRCLECTDVVLEIKSLGGTILDDVEIPDGTLMHTLIIHQIPEPMTIALLGLGGLFLRRRIRRG